MTRTIVRTPNSPQPVGPYSQGIKVGNFLFIAGQGPLDPRTGKIVGSDIESQSRRTLENIRGIVEAAGYSLRDVVKVSVFLKDKSDFQKMNEVYKGFFANEPPARTTVQADFVAPGMLLEIDAVAYRE